MIESNDSPCTPPRRSGGPATPGRYPEHPRAALHARGWRWSPLVRFLGGIYLVCSRHHLGILSSSEFRVRSLPARGGGYVGFWALRRNAKEAGIFFGRTCFVWRRGLGLGLEIRPGCVHTPASKIQMRPSSFGLCAVPRTSRSRLCLAGRSAYAKRNYLGRASCGPFSRILM